MQGHAMGSLAHLHNVATCRAPSRALEASSRASISPSAGKAVLGSIRPLSARSFSAPPKAGKTNLQVVSALIEPETKERPRGWGAAVGAAPMVDKSNLDLALGKGKEVEDFATAESIKMLAEPTLFESRGNVSIAGYDEKTLEDAYERCGIVTGEYAKTFYLGTQLMTKEKANAIWAIYVWCRRTDELVDGPNASRITPDALDRWEERLEAIFDGRPYDVLDAALADTVARFPLDIQPFRDMIDGMRMDLVKSRYETFDELYEYCYRVAGTVGLMSVPVMGVSEDYKGPPEPVYKAALALGTANQLTNILRDVGEDTQRNRIYVPLEDLRKFNITEEEVMRGLHSPSTGKMDDRWRAFMKYQINRARYYFTVAEEGVNGLEHNARWPVWSALIIYRRILDEIEANDYDNFTKRAYVPKAKKFMYLPVAYAMGMETMAPPGEEKKDE
mmetsp:Transcript_69936/g.221577  ORF Transcript_69936/g.221577 Transcript_69936/m.221577 type:complete len:446 (+) Transcript_69936:115-1452(+)|eukprot:CAMPEP_0182912774 /NCGR_PEP_ID=MMETSP0034_2-20130328/37690_1 /TAXON_ID=156128 /ORGANISM="Nephroselmis pyriformis, Strain CCMP717" /LENGTH=445 /DNA_ID=CAMNT_0025049467 /DNA_START=108 /DNA_END=1445 /DNA_ORIENTATION=+